MADDGALVMGAVAYDPKVVTIWDGFRRWFATQDFDFDYVLYSNYERQVEDLVAGRIDAAWNSPLAWIRSARLAAAAGTEARALTMRDTDCDLTSVVVVRADSPYERVADLRGKMIATGAVDSPQATLIPLLLLDDAGLDPRTDATIRRYDVGVGLHGDHVGGERDAARALANERHWRAIQASYSRAPYFRHYRDALEDLYRGGCSTALSEINFRFLSKLCAMLSIDTRLTWSMDYGDAAVRPLLDLEGLRQWVPGRTTGYTQLERAVDDAAFYDDAGHVTADEYRP